MSKVNIKISNRSFSFAGWLSLIFVVSKLVGLIDWSWWLVFLPIYIVPAIALVLCVVMAIIAGVIAILD